MTRVLTCGRLLRYCREVEEGKKEQEEEGKLVVVDEKREGEVCALCEFRNHSKFLFGQPQKQKTKKKGNLVSTVLTCVLLLTLQRMFMSANNATLGFCVVCSVHNDKNNVNCEMCGKPRNSPEQAAAERFFQPS